MSNLVAQIIAGLNVVVCVFILFRLLYGWGHPHMKYLAYQALAGMINAIGYFLETSATSQEAAWAACKIEYFSGPYLGVFVLLFGLEYAGVNFRKPALLFSLFIVPFFITLIIALDPLTYLYVQEIAYVPVGQVQRLVYVRLGPFYYVNFIYSFGLLLFTAIVCLKSNYGNRRRWYQALIFVFFLLLPVFSQVAYWTDLVPEIDLFYIACTVSIAGLYAYIKRYRQSEWYNLGSEAIMEKLNEAVMVVNANKDVVHINSAFFKFFPTFPRDKEASRLSDFVEYVKTRLVRVFPETLFENLGSFDSDYGEGEFTITPEFSAAPDYLGQTYTLTRQTIRVKDRLLGQAIVLSDVSVYRNMIEEIGMLKQRAEEASKSKSEFLATMSHEIRTPLNAIIGISEILLQKKQDAGVNADLERIYHSGTGLLGIINDILDISKIETGNLELIPVDYHVSSLVNDTVQLNIVRIGSKPIVFELKLDETIPARLFGDELRVRQILNNLLSNAIKYTQEGRVVLKMSWAGEAGKLQGVLTIRVSDTGQGIKAEEMDKLFSQYGQLNARANRYIEGTGLGLSITKNLVEMMDGSVQVYSTYGRGSVFVVTIRQKVVDAAPLGRETVQNLEHFRFIEDHSVQDKNQMSITISGGKVLVVDDVETNLYVARGLLQPYGLTIECVKSGQEAIDRIRETKIPYDMVFMDHMMPEMDGIEATGIIRSMNTGQTRRLPVIALTANAIVGMREMFLGQGFNDYLSKPISRSKLDEILVRWIPPEKQQPIAAPDAADAPAAPTDLSIEGVDTSQGVAMLGGSRDGYLEVLGIFCQDAAQRLEGLRKTPGSGKEELHAFTTQVHALKSASASIGAAGVSQQAAALEAAGRNEDLGAIGEHLEKFCADLEALVHNIRAALQVESAAAPAEDGEGELSEPLRELFTQLRQALEEQEIRPIDLLLEKLKAVNAGASLKQTIAAISGSVLVSEFAEAIAIIDAVLT